MIGKVEAYAKAHLAPSARRAAETTVASIKDQHQSPPRAAEGDRRVAGERS